MSDKPERIWAKRLRAVVEAAATLVARGATIDPWNTRFSQADVTRLILALAALDTGDFMPDDDELDGQGGGDTSKASAKGAAAAPDQPDTVRELNSWADHSFCSHDQDAMKPVLRRAAAEIERLNETLNLAVQHASDIDESYQRERKRAEDAEKKLDKARAIIQEALDAEELEAPAEWNQDTCPCDWCKDARRTLKEIE